MTTTPFQQFIANHGHELNIGLMVAVGMIIGFIVAGKIKKWLDNWAGRL